MIASSIHIFGENHNVTNDENKQRKLKIAQIRDYEGFRTATYCISREMRIFNS